MLGNDFYVISDTHFFHKNIERFCNRPEQIAGIVKRFPHLTYQHPGPWTQEEFMIHRWNAVVGKDDPVLHLGDVFLWRNFGDTGYQREVQPRLNGKKYLILGNHDNAKLDWEALGYTVIGEFGAKINGKHVTFSHYPLWHGELNGKDNYRHVHGHIHNNGYPVAKGEHGWRKGTVKTAQNQINVSVEMIDYTPQKIKELVK